MLPRTNDQSLGGQHGLGIHLRPCNTQIGPNGSVIISSFRLKRKHFNRTQTKCICRFSAAAAVDDGSAGGGSVVDLTFEINRGQGRPAHIPHRAPAASAIMPNINGV